MKRIVQITTILILAMGLSISSNGGKLNIHDYFTSAVPFLTPTITPTSTTLLPRSEGQVPAEEITPNTTEPIIEVPVIAPTQPPSESVTETETEPPAELTDDSRAQNQKRSQIQTQPQLKDPSAPTANLITQPAQLLVLVNKNHILPANYQPQLVVPQVPFYFTEDSPKKLLRPEAAAALERLFEKATQDGIELYAASGYRSYQRQKLLFNHYVQTWGEETASRLSARPGQSEHQTGLAMDVTSRRVNFILVPEFGQTPEGIWLAKQAPKFGFILRYPKDKEQVTGYQYEPWHLRYVGPTVARQISAHQLTLEEFYLARTKPSINLYQQRL